MRWLKALSWPLIAVIVTFILTEIHSEKMIRIESMEYFYDTENSTTPEEAANGSFVRINKTIPPKKSLWLRFKLPSQLIDWKKDSVLFTGSNETALSMHAYIKNGNEIQSLGFCDVDLDSEECQLPTLQYAFPLKHDLLKEGGEILIHLVPGASGINNEFYYMQKSYFNKATVFLVYVVGFSTGVYLLVALLSLVFFISLKESSFLFYSLFYFNLLFSVTINRGIWDAYVPEFITLRGANLYFPLLAGTVIFDLLFIKAFFEMSKKNKRLNKIYVAFVSFIVLLIVSNLIPAASALSWKIFPHAITGSMILAAITLTYFIWEKRLWAEQVTAAWGLAIVCNLVWTNYRSGAFSGFWLFGYYAMLGRACEAIILNNVIFQKLKRMTLLVGFADAKAQENNVVKTLLRTISHDLSNTTQLIKASSTLLLENNSPETQRRNIQHIQEAAQTQAEIIETAKSRYLLRGEDVVSLNAVHVKPCIDHVLHDYSQQITKKELKVQVTYDQPDVAVVAEKSSLTQQVLANLVSNACKFSDSGKTISIQSQIVEDAWVEISIQDQGIGIPAPILDRLFDEQEDISRPGTRGELGTGHGLLIAKDFVTAYGGSLKVESVEGQGTRILLRLKKAP